MDDLARVEIKLDAILSNIDDVKGDLNLLFGYQTVVGLGLAVLIIGAIAVLHP